MVLIKTVRLLVLLGPLAFGASSQGRPGPAHPNTPPAQNSKTHDAKWLKGQLRRRYGTGAIPEKSDPATPGKKPDSSEKPPQPPPSKN